MLASASFLCWRPWWAFMYAKNLYCLKKITIKYINKETSKSYFKRAIKTFLPPPQAWWTARCWSRWSEATACPAPRGAPSPCTRWWSSAGRKIRTRGRPSSTSSPSWRITSHPQSRSTNLERTYSLPGPYLLRIPTPGSGPSWQHELLITWLENRITSRINHYMLCPFLIFVCFAFSVRQHSI